MHRPATRDAERMPDVFDIYTIIFLALAVFIFLRLRSVLGQRTGRERPPYDPYSARDAVRSPATDKVVTLPPRPAEAPPRPVEALATAGRALEGHRRDRIGRRRGSRRDRGRRPELRCQAFHRRRARGLRDDRDRLCRRRPPAIAQSAFARCLRRLRCRDQRARTPRRNRGDAFCFDRRLHHHRRRTAQPQRRRSPSASSPSWFPPRATAPAP